MGAEGFEPPSGFLLKLRIRWAVCRIATGRRSSWSSTSANPLVVIPVQLEPAILPSYTILPCYYPQHQFLACRRARFRRRNFFLRHFQRWLPVSSKREPRFMVNSHPTCLPYMRASSVPHASFWPRLYAGSPTLKHGHPFLARREHHPRLPDWFSRWPRREGGLQTVRNMLILQFILLKYLECEHPHR